MTFHECPFDYCNTTSESKETTNYITFSLSKELEQDSQCQFERTGILCGSCVQNLSAILGISQCWSCSNKPLILFALAGIVLILFLTLFNLIVSEGKLSGIIFYANVVHLSVSIFIPSTKHNHALSLVLRIAIAWLNVDFGLSACLYDGMDEYAEAWLQFAFPLYLWFLAGLIVILCNRYVSVTRWFGINSVKVLATVVLLSFTKLLRAVITTFLWLGLDIQIEDRNVTRILWASDPNVLFLQGKHIPHFIFGVLFAIISYLRYLYNVYLS